MMNGVVLFFRFIKVNFGKFILGISLIVVFLFLLFPFSDLNDFVTLQVSKMTDSKVFLQFEGMHLNPITASLTLDKVFVETAQISMLSADSISIRPSFPALIQSKPGGTISAEGFLGGEFKISLSPSFSAKSEGKEANVEKYSFEANAENISLKSVKELLSLNLPIQGKLNLNAQGVADISFTEQPEGEVTLTINKFELPPASLSTQDLGHINLPAIKLEQIELKGKLANGKFTIETGKVGSPKDEFHGDIKGDMDLKIQNFGGQIVPVIGAYSLSLDMKANAAFKERAKFFLSFLDGYKKDLVDGTQYKFKIQATAMGMQPQFTPLQ